MNQLTQFQTRATPVLIAFTLSCVALPPDSRATCQTGCLTLDNTAVGEDALINDTGFDNTAVGFDALFLNAAGGENTAIGVAALFSNTIGGNNTAAGFEALFGNTTGGGNTATGVEALVFNTTGSNNTAGGFDALFSNITGGANTATGVDALAFNTSGSNNSATGAGALFSNTTGNSNTAAGNNALLSNTTGSSNIALGDSAGSLLTTGSNNIEIGHEGNAADANTIRLGKKGVHTKTVIAGIRGTTVSGGIPVFVDGNGRLGTATSSARFKRDIQPMDQASEAIFSLQPVTFRYKNELDPDGIPQFGLVAEDVARIDPDLVARDDENKPYTVRYEAVNAMLLNEFLKEHRKGQEQAKAIARLESAQVQQEKEIADLKVAFKQQSSQAQKALGQEVDTQSTVRFVTNR